MITKIFFKFLEISILWPLTFYSDPALAYCALPSMSLKLSRQSLQIAVALCLGSRICRPHKCHCTDKDTGQPITVDIKGLHGVSCASAGRKGRIARHDRTNNLIHRSLASTNYHCILKPTGLCHDKKRLDGFSLYPYTESKILAWDYTCRNTLGVIQQLRGPKSNQF